MIEEAMPVEEAPVEVALEPVPMEELVPVAEEARPAPVRRPWYKRLWRKVPAAVPEAETLAPAPVEEPVPVAEAAVSAPARRPWYKRFWRRAPAKPRVQIESPEADAMFSAEGDPLIKVGYSLRLSVSAGGRMEVPEQGRKVSDKGEISLPLIGSVVCEGLTLNELSDKISKLYEQYIRDPQASVEFVYDGRPGEISPWGTVMVSGEVNQPGRVNIPPTRDLTLSRAIQLSGGAPKTADQSGIVVFRRAKDGTVKRMVVNLLAVSRRGQLEKDMVLEPGDSIYVPESVW